MLINFVSLLFADQFIEFPVLKRVARAGGRLGRVPRAWMTSGLSLIWFFDSEIVFSWCRGCRFIVCRFLSKRATMWRMRAICKLPGSVLMRCGSYLFWEMRHCWYVILVRSNEGCLFFLNVFFGCFSYLTISGAQNNYHTHWALHASFKFFSFFARIGRRISSKKQVQPLNRIDHISSHSIQANLCFQRFRVLLLFRIFSLFGRSFRKKKRRFSRIVLNFSRKVLLC